MSPERERYLAAGSPDLRTTPLEDLLRVIGYRVGPPGGGVYRREILRESDGACVETMSAHEASGWLRRAVRA